MKNIDELKKYKSVFDNKNFKRLNKFKAHGNTSTMVHCINVANMSIKISKALNINVKKRELIMSALLHDLFFYDWHHAPKKAGLHGFTHPKFASNNAKKMFNVNNNVSENIKTHMWPINILNVPKSKEAVILCIADKICAFKEIFRIK